MDISASIQQKIGDMDWTDSKIKLNIYRIAMLMALKVSKEGLI